MVADTGGGPELRILPVGMPLGLDAGDRTEVGLLRCGGRFWSLPRLCYELWERVRVDARAADVGDWALDNEIDDADAVLDWLQSNGLLVAVRGDLRADAPVIRSHRLVPTALSGGLVPAPPGGYRVVGHDGAELARLDGTAYLVWSYVNGTRSIADVMGAVAAQTATALVLVYRTVWQDVVRLVQARAVIVDQAIG